MHRNQSIKVVGIVGLLGVALGAFGAHGLKGSLSGEMMTVYQTGVLYHLIHSAALAGLVLGSDRLWTSPWAKRASLAFR